MSFANYITNNIYYILTIIFKKMLTPRSKIKKFQHVNILVH